MTHIAKPANTSSPLNLVKEGTIKEVKPTKWSNVEDIFNNLLVMLRLKPEEVVKRKVTYISRTAVNNALYGQKDLNNPTSAEKAVNSVRAVLNELHKFSGKEKPLGFKEAKEACVKRLTELEGPLQSNPHLLNRIGGLLERIKSQKAQSSTLAKTPEGGSRTITAEPAKKDLAPTPPPAAPLEQAPASPKPLTPKPQQPQSTKRRTAAAAKKAITRPQESPTKTTLTGERKPAPPKPAQTAPEAAKTAPSTPSLPGQVAFRGLSNLGNTCYFNATIQALFGIDVFKDAIREYRGGDKDIIALKTLLKCYEDSSEGEGPIDKNEMRAAFNGVYPRRNGLTQEDAQESLVHIAEKLKTIVYSRERKFMAVQDNTGLPYTTQTQEWSSVYPIPVVRTAENILAAVFGIQRENRNWRDEQFWNNKGVRGNFSSETIRQACNGVTGIIEERDCFDSPPDYLPISLNRYVQTQQVFSNQRSQGSVAIKNSDSIEGLFDDRGRPAVIPVGVAKTDGTVEIAHYQLDTVIYHSGDTVISGHYYTYKIQENGEIWELNDRFAGKVELNQKVVDEISRGYMFFFRRVDAPQGEGA